VLELKVLIREAVAVDYTLQRSHISLPCKSPTRPSLLPATGKKTLKKLTRLSTCAITLCKVSALNHKFLNDPVEFAALVAISLFARRERPKVLSGLRHRLAVQPKDDAAELGVAVRYVEKDLVRDLGAFGRLGERCQDHEGRAEEERGASENAAEGEHRDVED